MTRPLRGRAAPLAAVGLVLVVTACASPEPVRVPLVAAGTADRTLGWRVVYERVDMDHPQDEDPRFFDRVLVAEGQLPPQPSP